MNIKVKRTQSKRMPKKTVLIDYNKCRPEQCDKNGICPAVLVCPHNLLKQEAPYEPPMPDPAICKGCLLCAQACPLKAVKINQ